jgi:hypothetical protein
MRRLLMLTLAVLIVATTALAAAATTTVSVPGTFTAQLKTLHKKGIGPVLLPQKITVDAAHVYPTVDLSGTGYALDLGAAKGCHGANACFVAGFSLRDGKPFNKIRVALLHGTTGYYRDLSCGGSCSPPSVEFVRNGFLYEIQANVGTEKTWKRILIAMANSAIAHGAR